MKNRIEIGKRAGMLAMGLAVVSAGSVARAAQIFWDPTNGTLAGTGSSTPSGTADPVNPLITPWNKDSTGGSGSSMVGYTSSLDMVFSAGTDATGSYTVTFNGDQLTSGMTFEEGNVTIQGANANVVLSVNSNITGFGSNGIIATSATATTTLDIKVLMNQNQAWTVAGTLNVLKSLELGNHNLTIDGSGNVNISGGTVSGPGNLAVTGTGTTTFSSNASAYTGTTNVNKGTLLVNVTHSGGANYTVTPTVSGSSATLGGTGTISLASAKTFTITGLDASTKGIVAPGTDGTTGTLTLGNSSLTGSSVNVVTFGNLGQLKLDLNGASADRLTINGNLVLNTGALLAFNSIAAPTGSLYTLVSYTGTRTGTAASQQFVTSGLPSGYTLSYAAANEIDLVQNKGTIGTITTDLGATVLKGTSVPFSITVQNSAVTGSAGLNFSGPGGSPTNVTGTVSGTAAAGGTSASTSGLSFNSATAGLGVAGGFRISDASATNLFQDKSFTVDVLNKAVVSATPSGTPVLPGGSIAYQNTTSTLAASAKVTTYTLTQGLNGTWGVNDLSNSVVAGGGTVTANVSFTPAANLLAGAMSTGNLSAGFTNVTPAGGAIGGSAANDGGSFSHGLSYTAAGSFAGVDRTGGAASFGAAQVSNVAIGYDLAGHPLSSSTQTAAAGGGNREVLGTTASLLGGTLSSPTQISMAWRSRIVGEVPVVSDVVDVGGLTGGPFVLQMSYDASAAGDDAGAQAAGRIYLGWWNDAAWVNAVDGDAGNNASGAEQNFSGSLATFQGANGTVLSAYIGAWGVDVANHQVWAVVDHNSPFAVVESSEVEAVPEPGSLALLGLGLAGALGRRRRV